MKEITLNVKIKNEALYLKIYILNKKKIHRSVVNTIHSKVILKNNIESMFESTKQLTQHIETPTGTEPINRKKVSQSKRSLYELYLKTLCLH